ncbi:hypothetical protein CLV92_1115 [Kineococcus xinjiangensis]|uniref:Uncharacterized protein n=1 Tax=Kineococcus xinjiangensis TaxID=512762 RepID=A0A2S6IFU8_9ACTN|nr:permease [Kineococcus xinjiangensis]PPK93089.1 hypothetical protein CLV92_1115 [Kineococcus xinjiangensis]
MTAHDFDRQGTVRETEVVEPAGATAAPGPVTTVRSEDRSARPMQLSMGAERRDRVRWGPIWAGLIVTLSTFLLLEVAFLALGWLTVGGTNDTTAGWVSGLIGLFSFFLGGLTAGATSMWRGASDGLLHGIMVWGLGVVGIVFLTLFGGGALFGSVANVLSQVGAVQQANLPDVQLGQAMDTVRTGAAWAALSLGLAITASAIGGLLGAKMWPSKRDTEPTTVDVR